MIIAINANFPSYKFKNPHKNPNFSGINKLQIAKMSEKSTRKIEFAARKLANKFLGLFSSAKNDALIEEFLKTDKNSPEFIRLLARFSRINSNKNVVNINLEDNRIAEIAAGGKPHIFIMNHDNQSKDPQMLALFNMLLNDEYLRTNQALNCPRPHIILNEDILLSMNKAKRTVFEKIGAVPVDASLYSADSRKNAFVLMKLMKNFIEGKANIFIFPEGRLSARKNAPLSEKFQTGVAQMVTKLAEKLDEILVTPLGFSYGKKRKNAEDSLYIGKTIALKKDGEKIIASSANISSDFAKENYKNFFNGRENAVITQNSIPVTGREQNDYVGGILCENLRTCVEEAKFMLKKADKNNPFQII